jgi:argininosuccinate lyase
MMDLLLMALYATSPRFHGPPDSRDDSHDQQDVGRAVRQGPAEIMEEINASIGFDQRLYAQDIAGSKAHADMLAERGIISKHRRRGDRSRARLVQSEIADGRITFSRALEDIHMTVESRLKELIGEPAGRLHTARSRNDQVATDFRLYIRDCLDRLDGQAAGLQLALAEKALEHAATVMPGFTHLQVAQPVTFGHHCLAYVEMLARDRGRFSDARARLNESPLGAAALAGTSFAIDREMTASALGFAPADGQFHRCRVDRDFVLETLAAAAIVAMHLSRLAEEIVLWASAQFGFVKLSDRFTTGSSIMPQKRNPDAAELVRAKPGRILGRAHRAAGGDEGPAAGLFQGHAGGQGAGLRRARQPVAGARRDDRAGRRHGAPAGCAAGGGRDGFSTATDLADWLVRALGMPFREAHHVTGALVALADGKGVDLADLSLPT